MEVSSGGTVRSVICFNASDISGAKKAIILFIFSYCLHDPLECYIFLCLFVFFEKMGALNH